MNKFMVSLFMLLVLSGNSWAAILVMSPNGTYTTKTSLEVARTAADTANKTVVVTSVLTEAQSNITAAWPADRALKVEKGGSIANTTTFRVDGPFSSNFPAFVGTGAVELNSVVNYTTDAQSTTRYGNNVLTKNKTASISDIGIGYNIGQNVVGGTAPYGAGGENIIIGTNALTLRTNPTYAIAIGANAMKYAADSDFWGEGQGGGNWSVAIGVNAAKGTEGSDYAAEGFVAIGEGALEKQTTGSANTAVGSLAANKNTTAGGIVAIGSLALTENTTGENNTAVGGDALHWNTTGTRNIAVGGQALAKQTSGNRNIGVGQEANGNNLTGNDNISIGDNSLYYNTASNNVAVGTNAGSSDIVSIADNANMTYIGKGATASAGSLTNGIAIGYGAEVRRSNSAQIGSIGVTSFSFGTQNITWAASVPLGSMVVSRQGDRVFNSAAASGQPKGWVCTVSGVQGYGGTPEATVTTSGSYDLAVDNSGSGYRVGYLVRASANFAQLTNLMVIAVTATSITVDRPANASGAINIIRDDPSWVSEGNL